MIRDLEPRDYPAAAEVLAETMVWWPLPSARSVEHWTTTQPARARLRTLVAEEDGRVVGLSYALLSWYTSASGVGEVWVGVAERARRRGIGAELYEVAAAYLLGLEPRKLTTTALQDSEGERFALDRGFARARTEYQLRLDVADADLSPLAALEAARATEGLRAAPLSALDDLAALYELYTLATGDIPADDAEDDIRPDEFERHILGEPDLDREASVVVLDGERPVALAFLHVSPESPVATSDLTGTLPACRGRGLARLAKLAQIRAARERGVAAILTENDADNAAMLRLNASLGFRRTLAMSSLARDL